jgi:hypothetical protein
MMKTKTLFCFVVTGLFTLVATQTFAQNNQSRDDRKLERQATRDQAKEDEQRLNDAVGLKRDTRSVEKDAKADAKEAKAVAKDAKADAKEANRIENDAADAAKQANRAARTEAKAQKSRQNADKQAEKANRASKKYSNQ